MSDASKVSSGVDQKDGRLRAQSRASVECTLALSPGLSPVHFDAPNSGGSMQQNLLVLGNMTNRGIRGISFICIKPGLYTAPSVW
jgi:hypothetical protein